MGVLFDENQYPFGVVLANTRWRSDEELAQFVGVLKKAPNVMDVLSTVGEDDWLEDDFGEVLYKIVHEAAQQRQCRVAILDLAQIIQLTRLAARAAKNNTN